MKKRLFEGLVATLAIASLASCGDATTTTKTKETTTIETTTIETTTGTKETTTSTTTEVPTTTMPETTTVAPTPTTTNPVVVEPLDLSSDLSTGKFSGTKEDKTIHFYHNYGDRYTDVLNTAVNSFKAKYPTWNVECGYYSQDTIQEDVLEDKVDLSILRRDEVVSVALNTQKVVNINDYLNASGTLNSNPIGYSTMDISDFVPVYFNEGLAENYLGLDELGFEADDRLSMPFLKSSDVLFMNLTALKEAGYVDESGKVKTPTTWDDLWEACAKVANYFPNSTPLGIDSEANLALNLLVQNGYSFTKDEAPYVGFAEEGAGKVFESLHTYYDEYYFTTMKLYGSYTSSLFNKTPQKGGAAFVIGSTTGASYYETNDFELGIATLPGTLKSDGTFDRSTLYSGYELVMFDTDLANSEERKLMTWEFVKCLEDTSFQANFSIASGLNPTRVSSYTNADYTTYLSSNTAQSTACAISSLMVGDYYTPKTFVDATYFKNNLANALVQIIKGANAQETLNKYAQDMRK